jgi:hypothetical protein
MNSKFGLSILMVTTCLAGEAPRDFIEVTLTPVMREYCHIVQFPQGWNVQRVKDDNGMPLTIDYPESDYEFRVEGPLSTWFLVGAFKHQRHRYDSTDRYRVNLSDPTAPILPANKDDWNGAAVVPLARKSIFPSVGSMTPDREAIFNKFRFTKSGARWPAQFYAASRISPDSVWLILQSETDRGTSRLGIIEHYAVFFDVFNTDTGGEMFTIEGAFSGFVDNQTPPSARRVG